MFNFFNNNETAAIKKRIAALETERSKLFDEVLELRETNENLKLEAKIKEEDIKHMVRMKEEKMALEADRKKHELQVEYDKMSVELAKQFEHDKAEIKDQYRDKLEKRLETEVKNMKEMYGEILQRLPTITAKMKGSLDG